ncbi:UDP-perosamine 4-acetyltransferase [Paenibacillus algorifonticola]|uniref:UDP-perosamine 4-acetyltransferase n=1 Tax=Paenibacillus algorifonticola TaxID=684063 RepID=A0A1I2IZM8_9BACL|nr:acetyltransferase [Paenibacillus algorifonticola]SFF46136.1 UDP-perosamine 4-acetyltransferase [Paenibacillus algorifonticola]
MRSKSFIIIGGSGHAKVCADLLLRQECKILGYVDVSDQGLLLGSIPYLGDDSVVFSFDPSEVALVNGVGKLGSSLKRSELYINFTSQNYIFETIIHDSATVSSFVEIKPGAQIMAGAIVQAGSYLGENVIINTRVVIEHDCKVGEHAHISPGAILCGNVSIGEHTHIGAGATVIQGMSVGRHALVGAGALVRKPVLDQTTVYGVPAEEALR